MNSKTLFDNIPTDMYSCTDKSGDLEVYHFERSADLEQCRHIRGVVIDSSNDKLVLWPIGLHDAPRVTQAPFTKDITIGIEGAMAHLFRYKGSEYLSTSKRIYNITELESDAGKNFPQTLFHMDRILGSSLFLRLREAFRDGYVYSFIVSYQASVHNKNLTFPHLYENGAVTYIGTRRQGAIRHDSPYVFEDRIKRLCIPLIRMLNNNEKRGPATGSAVLAPHPPILGIVENRRFYPAVLFSNTPISQRDYEKYSGRDDVFFVRLGSNPLIIQSQRSQDLTNVVNYNTDIFREFVDTYMSDREEFPELSTFIQGEHIGEQSLIDILNSLEFTVGMRPHGAIEEFLKLVDDVSEKDAVEVETIERLNSYRRWVASWVLFMEALTPWHRIYMIDHLRKFLILIGTNEWIEDSKTKRVGLLTELPDFPIESYESEASKKRRHPRLRDFSHIQKDHRRKIKTVTKKKDIEVMDKLVDNLKKSTWD